MICYDYFDHGRLLFIRYTGIIHRSTLSDFIEYVYTVTDTSGLQCILSDLREASLLISMKEISQIAEARFRHSKKEQIVNDIFLVDSPRNTALAIWLSRSLKNGLSLANTCSTLRTCSEFLPSKMTPAELEICLLNLKNRHFDSWMVPETGQPKNSRE